ncbi:hypothetical protein CFN78_17035 [Amycolatopsis antarctica]|uniref:PASTA domain-containing protein n=1 Tax=Amycolatopsis antarctica TaxID=1854586 RepID=A0A263D0A9_9PSEU|nr:PASTA domain-containing protein [Amycolatopsis antarctica]OZM71862.1 hypothetical protein CFN78_17035 [Amycolatopsis antarctica]
MSMQTVTPPAQSSRSVRGRWPWLAVTTTMALLLIAGFSGGRVDAGHAGSPPPPPAPVAASTLPTAVPAGQAATAGPAATASARPAPREPLPASGIVPDVVGMNYRAAQETLWEAGFRRLVSEDVTGQRRLLVWSDGWRVVAQSAEAGSAMDTTTPVTLSADRADLR